MHVSQANRAGDDKDKKWPEFHKNFLQAKGLVRTLVVPSESVRASDWFVLLSPPQRESLGYALHTAATKGMHATTVDLMPRIDRISIGKDSMLYTITPNNKTWLIEQPEHNVKYETNRLVIGRECLGLQGFPASWVDAADPYGHKNWRISDSLMSDLAGNAFSISVIVAAMLGTYLHLDWKQRSTTPAAPAQPQMQEMMELCGED